MNHGEVNNILYPLQHGFRRGRSYETQLLEFVDDLSSNPQDGQQVCHSLLMHKLHHYGIQGKVNQWTESRLADRTQSVVSDGERSDPVSVESGVPQGSVLGLDCSSTIFI